MAQEKGLKARTRVPVVAGKVLPLGYLNALVC